jgi:hypothetical protein
LRAKLLLGATLAWVREASAKGKRRTEVTEATKGGWGEWAKLLSGTTPAWVREASQRGTGVVGEISTGDTFGWGRESYNEKASKQKVY